MIRCATRDLALARAEALRPSKEWEVDVYQYGDWVFCYRRHNVRLEPASNGGLWRASLLGHESRESPTPMEALEDLKRVVKAAVVRANETLLKVLAAIDDK